MCRYCSGPFCKMMTTGALHVSCIHCKGGVSLTVSYTWSDPGQVSADYHGGQHDSNETKRSCNRHKLLVGRQRRASAKHGGTAHAHASALSADAKATHVECRCVTPRQHDLADQSSVYCTRVSAWHPLHYAQLNLLLYLNVFLIRECGSTP